MSDAQLIERLRTKIKLKDELIAKQQEIIATQRAGIEKLDAMADHLAALWGELKETVLPLGGARIPGDENL